MSPPHTTEIWLPSPRGSQERPRGEADGEGVGADGVAGGAAGLVRHVHHLGAVQVVSSGAQGAHHQGLGVRGRDCLACKLSTFKLFTKCMVNI